MTTPQQVLLDAAALIERGGWTRGAFVRHGTPEAFCLVGAIRRATIELPTVEQRTEMRLSAMQLVARVLTQRGAEVNLTRWNDDFARDAAEVTEVMRAAAVLS